MRASQMVLDAFEKEKYVVGKLYELLTVGEEVSGMSYQGLAKLIDTTQSVADNALRQAERAGVLARRIEYGKQVNGTFKPGRVAFWTLLVPKDEGLRRLQKWQEERLMQPEAESTRRAKAKAAEAPTAMPEYEVVEPVTDNAFAQAKPVTVAVEGEVEKESPFAVLKPLRKDEAEALMTAAKQYTERAAFVTEELSKFEAMGIHIDPAAVTFARDERLETVSILLPYLEGKNRTIASLERHLADLKAHSKSVDEVTRERDQLRRQVQRLIAEKADLQAQLAERPIVERVR